MSKTKKGIIPYLILVGVVAIVAIIVTTLYQSKSEIIGTVDGEGNVVGQAFSKSWLESWSLFAAQSDAMGGIWSRNTGSGGSSKYCCRIDRSTNPYTYSCGYSGDPAAARQCNNQCGAC
ncbi:MAG: hypothetical protein PHG05_01590 [Candidatus Nanoarchaeia archaeon]|nr:hypothetical protein [Candidatus Nanoarchaeia archaeon]